MQKVVNVGRNLVGAQRDELLGRTLVVLNDSGGFLVIKVQLSGDGILLHEERFALVEELLHVQEGGHELLLVVGAPVARLDVIRGGCGSVTHGYHQVVDDKREDNRLPKNGGL